MADESEVKLLPEKKMGRPTSNPKDERITVRLDEKSLTILYAYCDLKNIDRAEAVRQAIYRLEGDLPK